MLRLYPSALALLATGILGCARRHSDLAADRAVLLQLHAVQRQAHLEHNAGLLTASFADTFYSLGRGRVTTPTRAESTERFQAYFDQSEFTAWDDTAPPVIRISPDGQMAYVIVQKRVTLTAKDTVAGPRQDVQYAWLSTYEKRDGRWQLTALASTERPAEPGS
jgi:Domain of unknown function (DUF4440)